MITQLEQLVRTLENREAGWVVRRDAAELLGKVAQKAISALNSQRNDTDMDVQLQIERSLEGLYALALPGTARKGEFTLRDLAMACDKRPARVVEPHHDGYLVTVHMSAARTLKVHIMPYEGRDGRRLIRIYMVCGNATQEAMAWVLRSNAKLNHGAFAILTSKDGQEQIVLLNSLSRQDATPETIKASLKQIAFFGDQLERRLNQLDEP
jgi:hypothetical protein